MDADGTRHLTGTLYLAEMATGRSVGLNISLMVTGQSVFINATDPVSGEVVESSSLPAAIAAFLLAHLGTLL